MSVSEGKNWRVEDPFPGVELEHIEPVSLRARALFARRKEHPVLANEFLRVFGALDMLSALDHHFEQIARLHVGLSRRFPQPEKEFWGRFSTSAELVELEHARFEAIAYINALGRFWYFSKGIKPTPSLPTIERLLVFRHKATAHRSMDAPRGESEHLLEVHAQSLSSTGGQLIGRAENGEIGLFYQIQTEPGVAENFTPLDDHPKVMAEAYSALLQLLSEGVS